MTAWIRLGSFNVKIKSNGSKHLAYASSTQQAVLMGLTRVPRPEKDINPDMGGEEEEEDEDSENEDDSEDEIEVSPPSSPIYIRRMQILQAEHDRLERESLNQDVRLEQIKAWAAQMKYHTNVIASEISRINAKIATEKRNGASASGNGPTTTSVGFSRLCFGTGKCTRGVGVSSAAAAVSAAAKG